MNNTHLGNILTANYLKMRYDAVVKKILSDKQILAMILKCTVKEFEQSTREEIIACIEGNP